MEWSLGAELWSGVLESNFGVAKILITPAPLHRIHGAMYSMEWSLGAECCQILAKVLALCS